MRASCDVNDMESRQDALVPSSILLLLVRHLLLEAMHLLLLASCYYWRRLDTEF